MKALVVGGEHSFVRDVLGPRLSGVGIELGAIWDWDHKRAIQSIPSGCDCVIVIKDMTSHVQRDVARTLAKRGGLPFAEIPRKWAIALQDLIRAGFVHRDGDKTSMGRKKKTRKNETLVLQEDFNQTLNRIEGYAKTYFEKKARRPKAAEVSTALGIPTYHVAMQKGINRGVAKAKGVAFKEVDATINELVEMAMQDNPEWVLSVPELAKFMSEMLDKPNNSALQKVVENLATGIQRRWRRSADKRNKHPERVYLNHLMAKWADQHFREHHVREKLFPTFAQANNAAKDIFLSALPKHIYDATIKDLSLEVTPEVEAPEVEAPEVEAPEVEAAPEPTNVIPLPEPATQVHKHKRRRGGKMSSAMKEAIARHFDMLGKTYDTEVAKLCGVSTTSVQRYRKELGIPAFRKTKGAGKPSPATVAAIVDRLQPIEVSLAQVEISGIEDRLNTLADEGRLLDEKLREGQGALQDQLSELAARVADLTEAATPTSLREQEQRWETLSRSVEQLTQNVADLSTLTAGTAVGQDTLGAHIDSLVAKGFKVNISIEAGE